MTPAERQQLIDRYADGPRLLKEALAKVPEDALRWRPAPGKWSVHEVICHCADSETNAAMRIRYVLGEENAMIVAYDQDRWAAAFDYHGLPLEPSLRAIEAARAYTTALLERVPDEGWLREATHTESGRYTPEQWLTIYAEHLEIHARQIERNLAAWRERH